MSESLQDMATRLVALQELSRRLKYRQVINAAFESVPGDRRFCVRRVPPMLRSYLKHLASGRASGDLLFGQHWRDWPREWVQGICAAVGVPTVCAHSMRGLHSTLAMDAGITGQAVAASLGHESLTTTVQSYAAPEAVAGARQRRALEALSVGRASERAAR